MIESAVRRMPWTEHFQISHVHPRTVRLTISDEYSSEVYSKACNAAFDEVVQRAIDQDLFETINGQHSEHFAILGAKYPVRVERFAACLFGIVHRGAHMTAYTKTANSLKIWVPTRSLSLKISPGALDTTVAGGVRAGESPFDCIVHEAAEEASLPEALVREQAVPCGAITYMSQRSDGLRAGLPVPAVLYTYDLLLDSDTIPSPNDDEVHEFSLYTIDQVKEAMFRNKFKPNSALVMIDFFVRHGILTAADDAEYLEIVGRLHRKLPIPTSPGVP